MVEDDENGYIIKAGDIENIHKSIKKILTDKHLMDSMGSKSRNIFEKTNNYDSTFQILKDAIKSTKNK